MAERYFPQPSVMSAQQHFSVVPSAEIQRSTFDRSHAYKTTFNAGRLIPIFVDEVLPGDTFNLHTTAFCRLATPLKPVMDNMKIDIHFFFVPYRLVWDNWQRFMGERVTIDDDPSQFTVPQAVFDLSASAGTDLCNYMGLPPMPGATSVSVSALPFRAYYLIWNEWYRDQNLQNPITVDTGDGPDDFNGALCYPRGKRHDYFTSCLPWPQKGDPVAIPLGVSAPVVPSGAGVGPLFDVGNQSNATLAGSSVNNQVIWNIAPGADDNAAWASPNLIADLTAATAITINDLRTAFQIQRLLERDARGGTRYIELVLSHFGVRSDDARLQRPEYLGGGTSDININPIASTAPLQDAPQATLAAFGTASGRGGFVKSFTEHGVIIGLASVRADLTYQQGIERFWSRNTRYDFYWPALAHLGEQAVLNKEIYLSGVPAVDDAVFGYQERYAEYRYKPSRVTGLFNSEVAASLDVWHLAQDFSATPVLNNTFIYDNPPIDRIIAVPSEPHFLADIWFSLSCSRPMPVYSVPGLVDHF